MAVKIIGIAGGTGSGKTAVAKEILKHFSGESVVLIQQDAYYKDLSHLEHDKRNDINFDHPDALDNDLLVTHLKDLKNAKAINAPIYDFTTHTRITKTIHIKPTDVILLEGILVLADPRLCGLMDIKLFIDTDSDIRFIRRLRRDITERGRTLESVIEQFLSTVRPMHYEFVEQSKRYADLIVPEGGYNHIAIDMIISKIKSILTNRSE